MKQNNEKRPEEDLLEELKLAADMAETLGVPGDGMLYIRAIGKIRQLQDSLNKAEAAINHATFIQWRPATEFPEFYGTYLIGLNRENDWDFMLKMIGAQEGTRKSLFRRGCACPWVIFGESGF